MTTFVVGDKVRITNGGSKGCLGEVVRVAELRPQLQIDVTYEDRYGSISRDVPYGEDELELLEPVTASMPEPAPQPEPKQQPLSAGSFPTFDGFDTALNNGVAQFFAKIDKMRKEACDVAFLQGISFALSDSRAARDFLVERTNTDERGGK